MSACSSSTKLKKSKKLEIKGSRIYDSENGKCCHQCRQKTLDFVATCTKLSEIRKCTLNFCHKCLDNRYKENAVDAVESGNWVCPRCREICNCSYCMKKRGLEPTGHVKGKADRLTISEMLQLTRCNSNSEKKLMVDSKSDSDQENGLDGNNDSLSEHQPLKLNGNTNDARNGKLKGKNSSEDTSDCSESKRPCIDTEVDSEDKNDDIHQGTAEFKSVAEIDTRTKLSDIHQGTELKSVVEIDIPAEDVGHALQFLEFCEAFGNILNINEEQPELLLRDIVSGGSPLRLEDSPIVQFHIQLLYIIKNSKKKENPSSWLEALNKYISESRSYIVEGLPLDCFNADGTGYDELDTSMKLRLLNFFCDEALGTEAIRNWIDEQSANYNRIRKSKKGEALAVEKSLKKRMQDEMVQSMLAERDRPLSIADHQNLISRIKQEVAEAITQSPSTISNIDAETEVRSSAVRVDAIFSDEMGHKLWKLRSYTGDVNILHQDLSNGLLEEAKDRWFTYDATEKPMVENYISSFRKPSRK